MLVRKKCRIYKCSTVHCFKPRSLLHFKTFAMSSSEYQPTFKSRVCLSFLVNDFSFSLMNFSCEDAFVATMHDVMVYDMLLGIHDFEWMLGNECIIWKQCQTIIHSIVYILTVVLTPEQRSLSNPHRWYSRAIDMWSPFFHCLWSHSGTPISPLALAPQSLRSFAFSAFSSSAKCLRVKLNFLIFPNVINHLI